MGILDIIDTLFKLVPLISLYLLPSVVALGRKHPSWGSILVVNFFLGWTVIGWIVALAMAVNHIRPAAEPR